MAVTFKILLIVNFVLVSTPFAMAEENRMEMMSVPIFTAQYKPYNFIDTKGETSGYSVEIISGFTQSLKEQNITAELQFLPWARTYSKAITTKNALIFSIARTQEREDKFHWIGRLLPMPIYLFKHRNRTDIKVNDVENSKRWSVAGIFGGAPTICVEKMGYQVIHSGNQRAYQFEMLEKGRVDLISLDLPSFGEMAIFAGFSQEEFEPVLLLEECSYDLYLALSKNSEEQVVEAVQLAWQEIESSGFVNQVQQSFEDQYKIFQ